MIVKSKDGKGWQIKSYKDPERIYPKVYPTKEAAQKRINEMLRHKKPDKTLNEG